MSFLSKMEWDIYLNKGNSKYFRVIHDVYKLLKINPTWQVPYSLGCSHFQVGGLGVREEKNQ